ncbi:hypothetical protein GJ744_000081 [Endocarpon pusillum]|uniref:Clr5 domain-containing protein n=1 Tax=Endocarpon pusillum TaxID=364733 RepID=A0A8H7AWL5_9EURO|nr:hypothetical protein GJ744_000081 [Endocarpon pusillum]
MAGYPPAPFSFHGQEIPQRHHNLDPPSCIWPPAQRHDAFSHLYNIESSLPFNRPPIPIAGNNAAVSFLQPTFIPSTQSRLDFNSIFSPFPTQELPTSNFESFSPQRLSTSSFESFPTRGRANSSFKSFPTQGLINSSFEPFSTQEQPNFERLRTSETLEPGDYILDRATAQTQESQQDEDLQAQIADKPSTTQRTRISSAEWEKHKSTIKNLYLDQSQSLSVTCKYMADRYGFDVPHRAYKAKFQEWGFYKNLPKPLAQYILVKANQRKREENKGTKFKIGGQEITLDRARRSLKRSKADMGALESSNMILKTPPGLRLFTPSDTSSLSPLSLPSQGPNTVMGPPLRLPSSETGFISESQTRQMSSDQPLLDAIPELAAPRLTESSPGNWGGSFEDGLEDTPGIEGGLSSDAQGCVRLEDDTGEATLLELLQEEQADLQSQLEAGATLIDSKSSHNEEIAAPVLIAVKGIIMRALKSSSATDFPTFSALFSLVGRLILNDVVDDIREICSKIVQLGQKVFALAMDDLICLLVLLGRLLEKAGLDIARPYFEHALSILLTSLDHTHVCQIQLFLEEQRRKNSSRANKVSSLGRYGHKCSLSWRLEPFCMRTIDPSSLDTIFKQRSIYRLVSQQKR